MAFDSDLGDLTDIELSRGSVCQWRWGDACSFVRNCCTEKYMRELLRDVINLNDCA